MRSTFTMFWMVLLAALIACTAVDVRAGDDDDGVDSLQLLDLNYLPSDVFAVWIIHPQRIANTPMMGPFTQLSRDTDNRDTDEVLTPLFGIEFKAGGRRIETVQQIFAISPLGKGEEHQYLPFLPTLIFRFAEPVDGKKAMEEQSSRQYEELVHNGQRYYRAGDDRAFYLPDRQTLVFSSEPHLRKIISQAKSAKPASAKPASGPLLDRLRYVDARSDMIGAVALEPARELIEEVADDIKDELPTDWASVVTIPDYLETAVVTIGLTDRTTVRLTLDGKDQESAAEVLALANRGREGLRKLYDEYREEILEDAPEPIAKPFAELVEQLFGGFGAKLQGRQVVLSMRRPAVLDVFVASLAELAKSEQ